MPDAERFGYPDLCGNVVGGLDWQKTDPTAVLLAEHDAQFKRRGAAGDVAHWISLKILRLPN